MDVSEAKVLVAGGYGMGSQDNFKLIYKLSSYLNAAAGATRKAVDEGWAPAEIQVGQTGKTVAPEVYIACGISGALQHTLGIKHSKKIIAINNDPAAPIFSISDVAILGDVVDVLNELCKLIEDRKEQTLQ
jgi:electron transfer flavoprotein alpha subunit